MSFRSKPSSPSSGSGAAAPVTATTSTCPPTATITSETVVTIPANRNRKMVGVGEKVKLTFSPGSATWTTSAGTLSSNSGSTVIFTAPDRAASVDIKAQGGGCSASINFQVIEPNGVHMEQVPGSGTWHAHGIPSVGFHANIYITPDTVSFQYIEISEDDCVGIVTGYFVGTSLDGIHHAGHGAGTWVPVGPLVVGKGSQVAGQDTIQSGHANFGTPYTAGTFDWPIPWEFRVGGGAGKVFTTVHQRFTIDASGGMTASKGGASASISLNDPSSTY
jgi:hypothetical protein